MLDHKIDMYRNRMKRNIDNLIEQDINLNQSVDQVIQSKVGGFRSMHSGLVYRLNPINSVFHVVGDATSGDMVGR
jgi:hypothetical protein